MDQLKCSFDFHRYVHVQDFRLVMIYGGEFIINSLVLLVILIVFQHDLGLVRYVAIIEVVVQQYYKEMIVGDFYHSIQIILMSLVFLNISLSNFVVQILLGCVTYLNKEDLYKLAETMKLKHLVSALYVCMYFIIIFSQRLGLG